MNIPTRMRAVQFARHGWGLQVYEGVDSAPVPVPAADEVLVWVHDGVLNRLDDGVRIGWPGIGLPLPHISGSDFNGEIAAKGENVSGWAKGQRVTARNALWCGHCPAWAQGRLSQCEAFGILGESRSGVRSEYVALSAASAPAIGQDCGRLAKPGVTSA